MSDVVIIINFIKLIWQSNVFVSKIQNETVFENYIYFNAGVTRVTIIASVFVFFTIYNSFNIFPTDNEYWAQRKSNLFLVHVISHPLINLLTNISNSITF